VSAATPSATGPAARVCAGDSTHSPIRTVAGIDIGSEVAPGTFTIFDKLCSATTKLAPGLDVLLTRARINETFITHRLTVPHNPTATRWSP
jgi:hypothetical protein